MLFSRSCMQNEVAVSLFLERHHLGELAFLYVAFGRQTGAR
jgi:hypothetical protein